MSDAQHRTTKRRRPDPAKLAACLLGLAEVYGRRAVAKAASQIQGPSKAPRTKTSTRQRSTR